jgi:hypothetical protein
LILAPVVVQYGGYGAGVIIGAVAAIILILWSVRRSDRETGTEEVAERVTEAMVAKTSGD